MIRSIKGKLIRHVLAGKHGKGFPTGLFDTTVRKIAQLEAAAAPDDLRIPSDNRLEALRNDRAGQYSIRINDQWRVCFRWGVSGPEDVEIVDYH
ncbi:MAG: type II toxin-antitoxin system RelE/ParE family toxin [Pseudomonadota bacterium]